MVTALAAASLHAEVEVLPPVPDAMGFAGGFAGVCGNELIAGGGANFPDGLLPWEGGKKVWHDRLFALDLSKKGSAWREIGKLPRANGYGLSLTIREGILLIGGGDANGHFREVVVLGREDQSLNVKPLPPLPVPLAQLAGACVGRCVHVVGGLESPSATTASNRHWMLDLDQPDLGWKEGPPLPAAGRILATAASIGHSLVMAGGCSLTADASGAAVRTYLREVWKYESGAWKRMADLPRAAVAAASPAPTTEGAMFVVSGDDGTQVGVREGHTGFCRDILKFDLKTNLWTTAGSLSVSAPVTLPTAPWKNGFVLFNGEIRPGVRTPQVLLFTPESP